MSDIGKAITYLPDILRLAEIGYKAAREWAAARAQKPADQLTDDEVREAITALVEGSARVDERLAAAGWRRDG